MNITTLPNDLFLLIVERLSPSDLIICRSICKQFHAVFTDSELNRQALQQHFPRVRELREGASQVNWSKAFAKVVARYHHLEIGKPTSIEKFVLGKSFVVPKWARYYPISTWHQHLQFEEKTATFNY